MMSGWLVVVFAVVQSCWAALEPVGSIRRVKGPEIALAQLA